MYIHTAMTKKKIVFEELKTMKIDKYIKSKPPSIKFDHNSKDTQKFGVSIPSFKLMLNFYSLKLYQLR